MHVSDLNTLLWAASDAGKVLLLGIIVSRHQHKRFPAFFTYLAWDLISDVLLFLLLTFTQSYSKGYYAKIYFSAGFVTYLLKIWVLWEIAVNVLRPAAIVFQRRLLYWFLGVLLVVGCGSFFFAKWINPAPFLSLRVFLLANTTAAFLCLITFILIAGFSQLLGLTWKSHVLQLATGIAFYSTTELVVELVLSQLKAGPSYASHYLFWSRIEVIGYVGTVFFWCYAFLKQEAPRKEFSPQMQKILVSLSGSAKRQTAVLARSREP